jgi:hypothetical protein
MLPALAMEQSALMQTDEILAMLDDVERRLEAFARLDPAAQARHYDDGKWSGPEVLAHLSDADYVFFYRFLKTVAEPGGSLEPFDETIWAPELMIGERPAALSLTMIRAVLSTLRHHLETLPDASLDRASEHMVRGPQSARAIAIQLLRHSMHHLGQLDAIREGRRWTRAEAVPY